MFWGTDITRMPCSWTDCVRLFTEALPWLQGGDLDQVMGGALRAWIDWPLEAGLGLGRRSGMPGIASSDMSR